MASRAREQAKQEASKAEVRAGKAEVRASMKITTAQRDLQRLAQKTLSLQKLVQKKQDRLTVEIQKAAQKSSMVAELRSRIIDLEDDAIRAMSPMFEEYAEKRNRCLNEARSKRREAVKERHRAEQKVLTMQKKMSKLQDLLEDDTEDDSDSAGCSDDEPKEPVVCRLPFDVRPRRDKQGRFQAEDEDLHALRLAQLARGVAPSTVSANIQDVLQLVHPGVVIPSPCVRSSRIQRGEVTITAYWRGNGCLEVRRLQARDDSWVGRVHKIWERCIWLQLPG